MNIKKNDREYLGVNKQKILNAHPIFDQERLKLYTHYVFEREEVFKKRQQGVPYPWTKDEIIKNNSFTNNHRFNDRYSIYVLNNIINDNNTPLSDRIYKSILSRIYNTQGFCELVNISDPNFWNEEVVAENVKKLEDPSVKDGDIYTKAYRIVQPKICYKKMYPNNHHKAHALLYIRDLRKQYGDTIVTRFQLSNAKQCYEWIHCNVRGAGPFIAYQMFVDISYFKEIPFSDRMFAIAGPGCVTGLQYLYKDWDGLTAEELLWWHKNHFEEELKKAYGFGYDKLFDNEPIENRYFDMQECENSFCEFQKYYEFSIHKQRKRRSYRAEDIKPITHIITTTENVEDKCFIEGQNLLRNSQYNWMQLIKTKDKNKWRIVDQQGIPRQELDPKTMLERIREITKNK